MYFTLVNGLENEVLVFEGFPGHRAGGFFAVKGLIWKDETILLAQTIWKVYGRRKQDFEPVRLRSRRWKQDFHVGGTVTVDTQRNGRNQRTRSRSRGWYLIEIRVQDTMIQVCLYHESSHRYDLWFELYLV
jgi:hypothetical protein